MSVSPTGSHTVTSRVAANHTAGPRCDPSQGALGPADPRSEHNPSPAAYPHLCPRDAYDPNFQGQKASEDLVVHYHYEKLGCPHLVYYNTPWKPVVEL